MNKVTTQLLLMTTIVAGLLLCSCSQKKESSAALTPVEPETIEQLEQMNDGMAGSVTTGEPEMVAIILMLWRDTLKVHLSDGVFPDEAVQRCIALSCGRLSLLHSRNGHEQEAAQLLSEALHYAEGQPDLDTAEELMAEVLSQEELATKEAQRNKDW